MTPAQQQAFLDASGIQASELNEYLRLGLGLLIMRFLMYLSTLSVVLMLFFSFVVS